MSERWLLYDAGCSVCAVLAREMETLSGGRLRVRSLRDPEVRALLDRSQSRPPSRRRVQRGNRSMKRSSAGPMPNSARSAGTPNPTGTKCGCILSSRVLLWSHHYRHPDHRIAS